MKLDHEEKWMAKKNHYAENFLLPRLLWLSTYISVVYTLYLLPGILRYNTIGLNVQTAFLRYYLNYPRTNSAANLGSLFCPYKKNRYLLSTLFEFQ